MDVTIDILDDNGNIVDKSSKEDIYKEKYNHRIFHILVLNPRNNDIYVRKCTTNEFFLGGYLCTSVSGHVKAGESYEDAAKRKMKKEIDLSKALESIADFVFESGSHKRFVRLFITYAKPGFRLEDKETGNGEFISMEKLDKMIQFNEKIHPQLESCFEKYNKYLNNRKNQIW